MTARNGTYLYGIGFADAFRHRLPLATPGVGGQSAVVRAVDYGKLAALVSDAPASQCEITRDNLIAHQRVLEEAMQYSDIVPFAFGTVADNDRVVARELLRARFDELQDTLTSLHGRRQYTLRVFWNRERLFAEILAENEEIRGLRQAIGGQPDNATYFERIRIGELTASMIGLKTDQEADRILEALEPLADDTRTDTNPTDMMVVNAAFLVAKEHEPALDNRIEQLADEQADRLAFRYIGPMPPYSFVGLAGSGGT